MCGGNLVRYRWDGTLDVSRPPIYFWNSPSESQCVVWNFVGGVGFTLSGIFGFYKAQWGMYQSALSTFWGGWAFLIGSVVQWYESVNTV